MQKYYKLGVIKKISTVWLFKTTKVLYLSIVLIWILASSINNWDPIQNGEPDPGFTHDGDPSMMKIRIQASFMMGIRIQASSRLGIRIHALSMMQIRNQVPLMMEIWIQAPKIGIRIPASSMMGIRIQAPSMMGIQIQAPSMWGSRSRLHPCGDPDPGSIYNGDPG